MKPFKFTLEAMRVLRQRQEQDAMDAYARTLLYRQQAVQRLEAVQQEISASWHELRSRLGSGFKASEVAQAQNYHRSLEKRREECAAALSLAERRVNAALQAMLAARRQREVVDKFHSKQKAAHEREHSRLEQKVLDDLAASRRIASILSFTPTEVAS